MRESTIRLPNACVTRTLGQVPYTQTWHAMQAFTAARDAATADELWLLEHPPIYTYGIAGRPAHLPQGHNDVPVLKVDRGGQVTYHGPGQLIVYVLWDLTRAGFNVRQMVRRLEQAVIDLLAEYGVHAYGKEDAPGVYVENAKIASLGLKIRKGCCYHGLALNTDMDLSPFTRIDPCGYPSLRVTQLRDLNITAHTADIGARLLHYVRNALETPHERQ